jgi:aminopeptidase YwaD
MPDGQLRPSRRPRLGGTAAVVACAAACVAAAVLCACAPPIAPPHQVTVETPAVEVPATETPTPPGPSAIETVPPEPPPKPLAVSAKRMLADTAAIEDFGIRVGGGRAEAGAADYVAGRMRDMGYHVDVEKFPTPGGTSRNLIARLKGSDPRSLVLGAHLDTRSMTPGANDDAAGCAVLLEIARIVTEEGAPTSIEFVFFGSEEYNDGHPRDHHRGSRFRVSKMTRKQRSQTIGMISVDVVAYGRHLYTRTMGIGPMTMSRYLLRRASALDIGLSYSKDPGPTGWSDHEPYEKAGIPAVWIERLQDPKYHTAGDVTEHLQSSALAESARLVLDAVRHLDAAEIARIRPN